uniref:Uncharacterized protein n=1 Tax=Anopheles darlingi TaxID=43151 RepID=A0A2M4DFA4_ANODA
MFFPFFFFLTFSHYRAQSLFGYHSNPLLVPSLSAPDSFTNLLVTSWDRGILPFYILCYILLFVRKI